MSAAPQRSVRTRNILIGVAIVGMLAVATVWIRSRRPAGEASPAPASEPVPQPSASAPLPETEAPDEPAASAGTAEAVRAWTQLMGAAPSWPGDFATPEPCDELRRDLTRVCAALDTRVPELRDEGGTCELLDRLSSELAANPPDLASELQSYDAMLDNVFHVFRVLGKERMRALVHALSYEDLAEPVALAMYRWTLQRNRCDRGAAARVDIDALYSYAGFLFHTMGGQAYLRRRSPRVEALACFYGLDVLDRAITAGHNPQGLDPRSEIGRCRELVATQPLVFSEKYTETLDDMQQRWSSRGR